MQPVQVIVAPVDPFIIRLKEFNLDASDLTVVKDLIARLKKEANLAKRIEILKEIKTINIC